MVYHDPRMVLSPRGSVANLKVIYDDGDDSWAVAEMDWKGSPSLGMRWNGTDGSLGMPQSRGIPTWFLLPDEFENAIREAIKRLPPKKNTGHR